MSTAIADLPLQAGTSDWPGIARELGPVFGARAAAHDADDAFPVENYAALKQRKVFSAGIPAELGGGGATHAELCCGKPAKTDRCFGGGRTRKTGDAVQPKRSKPYSSFG